MRTLFVAAAWLAFAGLSASAATLTSPIVSAPGATLGLAFGVAHNVDGRLAPHRGVDVEAPAGSAVHAPADGVVSWVLAPRPDGRGYRGQTVDIDQGNGVHTLISNLQGVRLRWHTRVHAGEEIGQVMASENALPAHAHVEYRLHGRAEDPASHLTLLSPR